MNTISTSPDRPVVPSAQPIRCSSKWANLVRKECLESREAAIAGLAIFWLVPAVLGLIELALVGRHDVLPFAWLLVIGAGWLYAVIVGAHTVCRDWGKAEEHFLLAQPVSPRTVVCAKLITGAALVAGVLGIAVAWDMMLVQWTASSALGIREVLMIISVACVMAAGFALAFAVAVMTRQMLASTIVATLVLLVWAIAPLLSSHLGRFWVPVLLLGGQRLSSAAPFVLVSFAMLAVSAAASIYYSTRKRVFRLGNKQLAWIAGLVMLTLFGVAMGEVGNSLHVRDQLMLPKSGSSAFGIVQTIQRGDHFLVAYGEYGPQPHPEMSGWFIEAFRVSGSGHIQDLRRTPIPGALPPIIFYSQTPERRWDLLTGFAFDKDGHMVVSGRRLRVVGALRLNGEVETLWRTTLVWPDGGEPEVLSHTELALPPGQSFTTTGPWYRDRDHLPRFSYLVAGAGGTNEELYVFDWSDGPNPGPRYIIPLPQGSPSVFVHNGDLRVTIGPVHFRDQDVLVADFDADHPETLLDKQNWSFHELREVNQTPWTEGFERFGGGDPVVDEHGDVAYLSDLLGLRVARQARPGRWEIVGESRASPLSMLFRLYPRPLALDDSLVIEQGARGIIAYDVSDPSNPKRIGFLNTPDLSWLGLDASLFTTGQYLVLHETDLITVLDRPGTRKP